MATESSDGLLKDMNTPISKTCERTKEREWNGKRTYFIELTVTNNFVIVDVGVEGVLDTHGVLLDAGKEISKTLIGHGCVRLEALGLSIGIGRGVFLTAFVKFSSFGNTCGLY